MSVHLERAALVSLIAVERLSGNKVAVGPGTVFDGGDAGELVVNVRMAEKGDGEPTAEDEKFAGEVPGEFHR